MYIDFGISCPPNMLFSVPHKLKPMTFRQIQKCFPEFVQIFDGTARENTMIFYWKKNKDTLIYEFIDSESEEVAELMNVKIYEGKTEEELLEERPDNRQLTTTEINNFHEWISDLQQTFVDAENAK